MFTEAYADIDKLNKEHPRIDEQPFDSNTKCMITANKSGKITFSYLKGAPEIVLEKCDYILLNNKLEHLDQNFRTIIKHHYDKMSSRGERVLALAFKNEEKSFIFVGLVGIIDPPRPEIAEAISKCKEASIKVIMVTGDYSLTAEAIANMVGMSNDGSVNAITGSELNNISDEELKELLKKQNLVFARTTPIQKLRIVQTLQSNGEVVAVTGDGVNDAPALKNADIGISMGLMGTEVAKEASNMVLLDDNFSTIVHAVEQGRTIYSNIKKFITYILTSNVPQILPFIAFVLLGIPLPLTVVLILAIDLGTDLLPALGLGKEKAESDVMKYPPRSRKERLLTRQLLIVSYGIIGVLQAIAGFFSYFVVLFMGGWTFGESLAFNDPLYLKAVTAFFASIVICQIPDVLVCRTRKQSLLKQGLFSNGLVWLGIFTELLLLSVIVFVPFANKFFGTHSLSFFELSLSLPFALLILLFGEFRKFLIRKENLFVNKYLKW
jgi:sodium/potassium-transporting ATPase subunit alpha